MRGKRLLTVFLSLALTGQCLPGAAAPGMALAASDGEGNASTIETADKERLTHEGWEYTIDGVITGYTGTDAEVTLPTRLPGKEEGKTVEMWGVAARAMEKNGTMMSLTIPEGYEEIDYWAFKDCTALEKVAFPTTVTRMPDSPSSNSLSNSCAIFMNCTALSSVEIPEGVTYLGKTMFTGCTSLEEVTLPSTLESWDFTFQGAPALKKVTIPEGIKVIGESAFVNCYKLKSLVLPDSVELIKNNAYSNAGLTSLTLPKSLKAMGNASMKFASGKLDFIDQYDVLELHSLTWLLYADDEDLPKFQKIRLPRYSVTENELIRAGYTNLEYLPGPEDGNLKAVPYEGEYDAQEHEAVRVEGLQEGDVVTYSSEKYGPFTEEAPVIRDAGNQSIWVRVEREPYYSPWQVNVTATVTDSRADQRKEIEKELSKAERLAADKGLYTEESWSALEEAVSQAQEVLGREDALAGELKDALDRLTAARTGLAAIGGPGTTEDPGTSSGPGTTDGPGTSSAPGTTDGPGSSSAPGTTDDPGTSSAPGTTDDPGTSNTPGTTDGPGSSSQPGTTETPGQQVTPTAPPETPAALKKPVLKKVASGKKKKLTVKWKKVAGASGYQIAYSYRKDMKKAKKVTIGKGDAASRTIAGLKSRKACYVRIRAWAKVDGRKVYSAWSSVKKGKVK